MPWTLACAQPALTEQSADWKTQRLDGLYYSEGATSGDFNQDGHVDVASGPLWFEGPNFTVPHRFYHQEPFDQLNYANNFLAVTDDFNGDGWDDILVVGFPGEDASWFENPQVADRYWPRHQVMDTVDNESPTYVDLTGDGRGEIVCSVAGYFGFAEVNREAAERPWVFRRISDESAGGKFTHGLGVGDVDGDGRIDLLEKSGWWRQPESMEGDPVWEKHSFMFGQNHGPSQMFAYDVDGDGDNDVVCARDAHGYGLAWFEHHRDADGNILFRHHLIMGDRETETPHGVVFSQLHAAELVDIDGDGLKDILTGKRYWAHGPQGDVEPNAPAVVVWFQLQRGDGTADDVRWTPHQIHDDSGVGLEVNYADLNDDGALDVFTGNKKGVFVHIQSR